MIVFFFKNINSFSKGRRNEKRGGGSPAAAATTESPSKTFPSATPATTKMTRRKRTTTTATTTFERGRSGIAASHTATKRAGEWRGRGGGGKAHTPCSTASLVVSRRKGRERIWGVMSERENLWRDIARPCLPMQCNAPLYEFSGMSRHPDSILQDHLWPTS